MEPLSPQRLIKSFVDANLPSTLDLSLSGSLIKDWAQSFDSRNLSFSAVDVNVSDETENSSENSSELGLSLPDSFEKFVSDHSSFLKEKISSDAAPNPACTRCDLTKQYYQALVADMKTKENELRYKLSTQDHHLTKLKLELDQTQQLAKLTEEKLKLEIFSLTDKCQRLQATVDEQYSLRNQADESARRLHLDHQELSELRSKVTYLEGLTSQQRSLIETFQTASSSHHQEVESLRITKDLLEKDKKYLESEIARLESRLQSEIANSENSRSKVLALELKTSQLSDELLHLQLRSKADYDQKLEKELQRMREEAQKELETSRLDARELLDREVRLLREAKLSLENDNTLLRRKNEQLTTDLFHHQQQSHSLLQEKIQELQEVKSELKLKTFEWMNLSIAHEERNTQTKQYQIDLEKASQELLFHKTALARLETEYSTEREKLQHSLEVCQQKLQSYEILEVEIDQVILNTAKHQQHDSHNNKPFTMPSLQGIPVSPEGRIKQSLLLAQKLLAMEKDRDRLQHLLSQTEAELAASKQAVESLKEDLSRAAQPTTYLIHKLHEEEQKRLEVQSLLEKSQRKESDWKTRYTASEREVSELTERLELLLRQRGELETVREMVEHLQGVGFDSSDEEEEEEAEESADEEEEEEEEEIPVIPQTPPPLPRREAVPVETQTTPEKSPEDVNAKIQRMAASLGLSVEKVKLMMIPPSAKKGGPGSERLPHHYHPVQVFHSQQIGPFEK